MYYLVYKTTNTKNGKIYFGSHVTKKINDGYIGSGVYLKKAIKKYGRKSFKREIIAQCFDFSTMRDIESQLVKWAISKYGRDCYNRADSGTGSASGENNHFYGRKHTDETRKKISEKKKGQQTGYDNPFYSKKHSGDVKNKLSELAKDRYVNNIEFYKNVRFRDALYWWCTPVGCFYSRREAEKYTGVSGCALKTRCMNPDKKITKRSHSHPEYFLGKTWRELGYYHREKNFLWR